MSRNIHVVRQELRESLSDRVREITCELSSETDEVIRDAPRLLDRQRLRGIPAVGEGVDGAIPGTNPTDWIDKLRVSSDLDP